MTPDRLGPAAKPAHDVSDPRQEPAERVSEDHLNQVHSADYHSGSGAVRLAKGNGVRLDERAGMSPDRHHCF